MEGMTNHDENISIHFFNLWNDIKVNINGMCFKIMEEVIFKVGGFTMGSKNWRKKARVNDETNI